MPISDVGKIATAIAGQRGPGRGATIAGGLAEGYAKFLDFKKAFNDAKLKMQWEEEGKIREFGREKEKAKITGRAGLEKVFAEQYQLSPWGGIATGQGIESELLPGYGYDVEKRLKPTRRPTQEERGIIANIRSLINNNASIEEINDYFEIIASQGYDPEDPVFQREIEGYKPKVKTITDTDTQFPWKKAIRVGKEVIRGAAPGVPFGPLIERTFGR